MRALLDHLRGEWPAEQPNLQIQVLGSAFYRNKAASIQGLAAALLESHGGQVPGTLDELAVQFKRGLDTAGPYLVEVMM